MSRMQRQSLLAYGQPLCETVADCPSPRGADGAPLAHQPGTIWEYSLAVDLLGRIVEAALSSGRTS
jgi:hypothetical protein